MGWPCSIPSAAGNRQAPRIPGYANTSSPAATARLFPRSSAEVEKTGLWITDIEILRLHYAETLKHWYDRFQANRDKAAALYDERFCRMWEFYLAGSEAAFRHQGHMVFQMQLTRRQEAVPFTRDYMTNWEHARKGVRRTAA